MVPHFEISQYCGYGTNRSSVSNFFTVPWWRFRLHVWNRIPSKSLSYNAITSLFSLSKSLPFATLRKNFSSFMYVLKSSWSNRSLMALMIQSKDSYYIFLQWDTRHHRILVLHFPQAFLESSWRSFLSWRSRRVYIEYSCFIFDIFLNEVNFLITSHFS